MKPTHIQLIYFSPTGTTQKILRSVAVGTGSENITETDLTLPNARECKLNPSDADLFLFGVPVYEEHTPPVIRPILKELIGHGQNAVIVAVYGNVGYGLVLQELEQLLTSNRFNVIAGAAFIGEHSYSHNDLQIANGRPDEIDLQIAKEFGKQITQKLQNGNPQKRTFPGKLPLMSRVLPEGSASSFAHLPILDQAICSHCGLCAKKCPVNAIDHSTMEVDVSKCLRCFACVRACPQNARSIKLKHPWIVKRALQKAVTIRQEPIVFL